jgi:hypothetical protein
VRRVPERARRPASRRSCDTSSNGSRRHCETPVHARTAVSLSPVLLAESLSRRGEVALIELAGDAVGSILQPIITLPRAESPAARRLASIGRCGGAHLPNRNESSGICGIRVDVTRLSKAACFQQFRAGSRPRAALALADDEVPASLRAAALAALAFCLAEPDTFDAAEAAANESLELARSIGDVAQCASSTLAPASAALNVNHVADSYRYATDAERLARQAHDEPTRVAALRIRALMAPTLAEALALGEQAAAAHRREGSNRRLAALQTSLIYTALYHGDYAAAQELNAEALRLAEELGDPHVSTIAHGNAGLVALLTGDATLASRAFAQELRLANRHWYDRMLYEPISGLAGVAAARGEDELAARLSGAAEATGSDRHDPVIAAQLEERCFAPARARLGEPAWRSAHTAGAELTPRQAVDTALSSHLEANA